MKGSRAADAVRENWLLIKEQDDAAGGLHLTDAYETSVISGRSMVGIGGMAHNVAPPTAAQKTPPRIPPAAVGRPARYTA